MLYTVFWVLYVVFGVKVIQRHYTQRVVAYTTLVPLALRQAVSTCARCMVWSAPRCLAHADLLPHPIPAWWLLPIWPALVTHQWVVEVPDAAGQPLRVTLHPHTVPALQACTGNRDGYTTAVLCQVTPLATHTLVDGTFHVTPYP